MKNEAMETQECMNNDEKMGGTAWTRESEIDKEKGEGKEKRTWWRETERETHLVRKKQTGESRREREHRREGRQRMNEDGESEGKMRGRLIFLRLNLHKTFITTNLGREP